MAHELTQDTQTVVYLGNRAAVEVLPDPAGEGETIRVPVDGPANNCTTVRLGESRPGIPVTLAEAFLQITDPHQGVWQAHSDADQPAWVAASGPIGTALAQLLSAHWRIEVREPDPDHGSEG